MIQVRSARPADENALGRYGGALMRQHHADDPRRFIKPENPEPHYGRFLVAQQSNPSSLVLVAEDPAGRVVGYVYADVEGTNWMELRGPCGVVHDIYVDESARRLGAGRALLNAAVHWIHSKGRTQVVLLTKTRNEHAHHLFQALGFRPTMIEMTLDLDKAEAKSDG